MPYHKMDLLHPNIESLQNWWEGTTIGDVMNKERKSEDEVCFIKKIYQTRTLFSLTLGFPI